LFHILRRVADQEEGFGEKVGTGQEAKGAFKGKVKEKDSGETY